MRYGRAALGPAAIRARVVSSIARRSRVTSNSRCSSLRKGKKLCKTAGVMASAIDHHGSLGDGRAPSAEYPGMAVIMVLCHRLWGWHARNGQAGDKGPPAPPSTIKAATARTPRCCTRAAPEPGQTQSHKVRCRTPLPSFSPTSGLRLGLRSSRCTLAGGFGRKTLASCRS